MGSHIGLEVFLSPKRIWGDSVRRKKAERNCNSTKSSHGSMFDQILVI